LLYFLTTDVQSFCCWRNSFLFFSLSFMLFTYKGNLWHYVPTSPPCDFTHFVRSWPNVHKNILWIAHIPIFYTIFRWSPQKCKVGVLPCVCVTDAVICPITYYLLMGKMINELERMWQAAVVSKLNWPGIYLPWGM
jgi:hypothetical protein